MNKVLMYPMPGSFKTWESGIRRVIEAYVRCLPRHGWQVADESGYDIVAIHAGTGRDQPDVAHCHGLYWTNDYQAATWEYAGNASVIDGIRRARKVTVPSNWVKEVFQRDMRFTPTVVPHGIDWENYTPNYSGDYVLWNKNRDGDVCDPTPMNMLASEARGVNFVTTFSKAQLDNVRVIGLQPHKKMMNTLANSSVYLSTTKETFGIGILEAMAMGKPVLGFAHGGILDIVSHGVNGYLARPGDIEDLERGLFMCLDNQVEWGKNSRELVKRFTWDKAATILAEIYNECLVEEPAYCDIVIPVFNKSEEALVRAISSAKSQKEYLGEVIVVDDGSRDELGREYRRICESMQVTYLAKENGGVATARNYGISHGKSKYVCCLDSDDAIDDRFLLACVPELEADRGLGIAYTGLWSVQQNGREGLSQWPGEFNYDEQLRRKNQIPTCCVFRREMWERLGGYKQRYAPTGAGSEDAEFWLRAGAYGYDAKKVTTAGLFIYSLGGGHTSQRGYREVDWTFWHPWTKDGKHPVGSVATPERRSHPVRQYDEPSVSVIIPVGPGHEEDIEDALDSLEAQTMRKWEVIVVYDGHEGLPKRILDAYPYIRLYKTSGARGAGYARNLGVSKARAQMLFFLDADDFISPSCLEEMISEWSLTGSVVYTDYYGVAIVDDPSKLSRKIKLVSRDESTGESVLKYESGDFDCEKAMRQPDNPPYIWCNVNMLVPRIWFDEVGGFDEHMPAWEDCLLAWQLAWSGKCFSRIEKPLMTYRFASGSRREAGHKHWDSLIKYANIKKENFNMAGCKTCPGNKSVTPPAQAARANISAMRQGARMQQQQIQDDNMVLIRYMHPNRGQHAVRGYVTKIRYGHKANGDTFLVHRDDIEAQPHLFVPIKSDGQKDKLPEAPRPVQEFDAQEYLKQIRESWENNLDLQKLPGVTPSIAKNMENSGFTTMESILSAGSKGLQEAVDGIGEVKAEMIIAWLEDKKENG